MNANVKLQPASTEPVSIVRPSRAAALMQRSARYAVQQLLPPLVILLVLGVIWEMLCSGADAALPPPSQVIAETWELIVDPFYDNGGNDVGLARNCWRASNGWRWVICWRWSPGSASAC